MSAFGPSVISSINEQARETIKNITFREKSDSSGLFVSLSNKQLSDNFTTGERLVSIFASTLGVAVASIPTKFNRDRFGVTLFISADQVRLYESNMDSTSASKAQSFVQAPKGKKSKASRRARRGTLKQSRFARRGESWESKSTSNSHSGNSGSSSVDVFELMGQRRRGVTPSFDRERQRMSDDTPSVGRNSFQSLNKKRARLGRNG